MGLERAEISMFPRCAAFTTGSEEQETRNHPDRSVSELSLAATRLAVCQLSRQHRVLSRNAVRRQRREQVDFARALLSDLGPEAATQAAMSATITVDGHSDQTMEMDIRKMMMLLLAHVANEDAATE